LSFRTGSTTDRADFISPTTLWARSGFVQKSAELCSSSISFRRFSWEAKSKRVLQLDETGLELADALAEFLG
jgi:hypothetical protein